MIVQLANMGTTQILIFVFMGIFFVIFIASHYAREKKRRALLGGWAREKGFAFDAAKERDFHKSRKHFRALNIGHTRRAFNTVRFAVDWDGVEHDVRTGDYCYTIQSGRSSVTHTLSYLLITLPYKDLAPTRLRPEGIMDGLGAAIGFDDIDFEDAGFSKRYHVTSKDKRFAYDLFDPRMIETIKGDSITQSMCLELAGDELFITSQGVLQGKRWDPPAIEQHLAFAKTFLGAWPDHLVASLR